MQRAFLSVFVLASFLAAVETRASDTVINFDDITTLENDPGQIFGGSYGGLVWETGWRVTGDERYTGTYANSYDSPSGRYAADNYGREAISVWSLSRFNFRGAYFAAWGFVDNPLEKGQSPTSLTVDGYRDASLVSSITFSLSTDRYDWVNTDLTNIDKLVFTPVGIPNPGYELYWLMDDFTYQVVPEPASAAIFTIGTFFIALKRKQR